MCKQERKMLRLITKNHQTRVKNVQQVLKKTSSQSFEHLI